MQVSRITLYVVVIVATGFARVYGGTEISGGVLFDKIIYASTEVPDKGIYYMDYDGSDKTRITYLNPHEYLSGFSISPCGSKVAYGSYDQETTEAGVYLVNIDGSDKTKLVGGVYLKYSPFFDADGRGLLFITGYPGENRLYSVTLERTAIIDFPDEIPDMTSASFSTDGKLVFFGNESGETGRIGKWDIERRRVTYISDENVSSYAPCVSPDGKLIAYGVWEDGRPHLYVMDSEGKCPLRLTYDKDVLLGFYSFSPDSKNIVFAAEGKDGLEVIYKIAVDGTGEERLTYNQSRDIDPVYSPDGQFIAFESMSFDDTEIFVMKSDGTELKRLTPEGDNWGTVFSPMLVGDTIIDTYGNKHPVEE
jgi:Tol biopolymer transport system component